MKSTGAVCEEKAGADRPGQKSPSGGRTPVEASAGPVEALTSAVSAAAPGGAQAAQAALAGVLVALVARAACGASS